MTTFYGHDGYTRVLVPRKAPEVSLFVGLDLGQVADSTALIVVEKTKWPDQEKKDPTYGIRHIQRWLGESYVDLVGDVAALFTRPPLDTAKALIVDATGLGRVVIDLFRKAKLPCCLEPVVITGWDKQ